MVPLNPLIDLIKATFSLFLPKNNTSLPAKTAIDNKLPRDVNKSMENYEGYPPNFGPFIAYL